MEHLPWPLEVVMFVRSYLTEGKSVRMAIEDYLKSQPPQRCPELRNWYLAVQNAASESALARLPENLYQRNLLFILTKGLRGDSISSSLSELEKEFLEVCDEDLERFASRLPSLLMVVTAVLIFPAFMLLILGPIVSDMLRIH